MAVYKAYDVITSYLLGIGIAIFIVYLLLTIFVIIIKKDSTWYRIINEIQIIIRGAIFILASFYFISFMTLFKTEIIEYYEKYPDATKSEYFKYIIKLGLKSE